MTRLVAVDPGNGWVKAMSSTARALFPSVGAVEQGAIRFDGLHSSDDLVIDFEGERWAIGQTAYKLGRMQVIDMGRARVNEDSYRRLYVAALAAVVGRSDNLAVVASLPAKWYTGDRDAARAALSGTFTVKLSDRTNTYHIQPGDCHIVPEGFGSLCTQVISMSGQVTNAALGRGRVGVVDIGTRTTDLLFFDALELYPARSDGLDSVGMATVWQLVGERISQRYGRDLNEFEIDQAVHTRYFNDAGQAIDITDECDRAAGALAESISGKIRTLWEGGRDVDAIIVTGGGGPFVFRCLDFPHKFLTPDSYFANTEGAYRFGLLRGFASNGQR